MLDLYLQNDKSYQNDGGINKDRDKALMSILNDAARLQSASATTTFGGNEQVEALLTQGKFTPQQLTNLGFPDSVIQERLKGAPQNQIDDCNNYLNDLGRNNSQTSIDLTKWEDDLLRGGTIISTLADHHIDQNDVLGSIENLSRKITNDCTIPSCTILS